MRILKNKVLSVGTERLPTWRRTNVFFSSTTYMEEGFKLWLQRLRLACILPKHSSTVDLFLIAQPWGIPPPLPRQTRTHITSFITAVSLSHSFHHSPFLSTWFFPHDSLRTHVLPVVLLLWENFTSDRNTAPSFLSSFRFPSLPLVLSGTGGRMWQCKGGVGSALFNISHPPVVKCYAFRKVQGRVSELRLGGENIWRTVLKVNM